MPAAVRRWLAAAERRAAPISAEPRPSPRCPRNARWPSSEAPGRARRSLQETCRRDHRRSADPRRSVERVRDDRARSRGRTARSAPTGSGRQRHTGRHLDWRGAARGEPGEPRRIPVRRSTAHLRAPARRSPPAGRDRTASRRNQSATFCRLARRGHCPDGRRRARHRGHAGRHRFRRSGRPSRAGAPFCRQPGAVVATGPRRFLR